jgi:tetratricopeptide (TPR) repeat protein
MLLCLASLAACAVSACAPKTIPPPAVPKYPGFAFPAVPEALEASPAAASHRVAWNALQSGDLRQAERRFGASLKNAPDFYPSEAGLGYVALARKDFQAATDRFTRALASAPTYVPALLGRGEALLEGGKEEEALTNFSAALDADASLGDLRPRIDVLRLRVVEQRIANARQEAEAGRLDSARERYAQAIQASPESAFLHRELASVEQRAGRLDEALASALRAVELDAGDARALVTLADVHEARTETDAAISALERAAALEPNAELTGRIERMRERAELARLPASFHAIGQSEIVTRGDVAALIGIRLRDLVASAGSRAPAVITDTRGHWAAAWILGVARAGVMEVYPNHTFQPAAQVRRGDFAETLARAIEVIAVRNPEDGRKWREAQPRFEDLGPGHPSYPAAALAVAAGTLAPLEGDTFQPTRAVTGAEATSAIERLRTLWTRKP